MNILPKLLPPRITSTSADKFYHKIRTLCTWYLNPGTILCVLDALRFGSLKSLLNNKESINYILFGLTDLPALLCSTFGWISRCLCRQVSRCQGLSRVFSCRPLKCCFHEENFAKKTTTYYSMEKTVCREGLRCVTLKS